MFKVRKVTDDRGHVLIQDPPFAEMLFQNTRMSWLWLALRLWAGWAWLEAGWHKFNDPQWMDGSGQAILSYWQRAVAIPPAPARPPITYDWYRAFLQMLIDSHSQTWFTYLIVFGELAVGIALITGLFTGIAAAGGLTMNMAFMLAGTASINPVLAMLSIAIILAWKTAGYLGADRYILPLLGTPWSQPWLKRAGGRITPKGPRPGRPPGPVTPGVG